jgi:hypothetical protein
MDLKSWRNLFVDSTGIVYCDKDGKYEFPLSKKYILDKKTKERIWDGYLYVKFPNQRRYFPVHRIMGEVFLHNPCPNFFKVVDHVDRNRSNNNASNLRFVNPHLNAINRRPTGIRYKRFLDGWRVLLFCKNRVIRVGVFKYYNQAYKAACNEKLKLFDEQYKKYLTKYKNACLQKENEEAKKSIHQG